MLLNDFEPKVEFEKLIQVLKLHKAEGHVLKHKWDIWLTSCLKIGTMMFRLSKSLNHKQVHTNDTRESNATILFELNRLMQK